MRLTGTSQTACCLFRLPPELRNRIYDYVFTVAADDDTVTLRRFGPPRDGQGSEQAVNTTVHYSVLSFLQTCQAVLDEAECTFYHITNICLDHRHLSTFLRTISRERRGALRSLTCSIYYCAVEDITKVFKQCYQERLSRLRSLRLLIPDDFDFGFGYDPHSVKAMEREWWFGKKALQKLGQVDEFRVLAPKVCNKVYKNLVEG